MAELATIARPYAEALFQAVASDADHTSGWLDELADVAANAELKQFADNPKISVDQIYDLITGVLQSTLPDSAKNFLRLVLENGRLGVMPEIAAQFRVLQNTRTGTADATVFSAFTIDAQAIQELTALLEKRFNKKLNLTVELAPELIGGIRVAVGDEVLDTSIKARLEQMKVALTA